MSRLFQNKGHIITQGYHSKHEAVDIVADGHSFDYVTAHSAGVVTQVINNCNINTSGDPKFGSNSLMENSINPGNIVVIKHDNGYYTRYYHLKYKSVTVKVGERVELGQVIGYMGNTGYSFGGHLHFEVRNENDEKVNPTEYLEKDLPEIKKEEFPIGNYKTLNDMYVRYNAGLIYGIKLVKHLTKDGKRNATSKNPNALAVYKKGTIFTALKVIHNNYGVWAKTPSGYVCIKGLSGKIYSKKL